jgi:hypothetical protein
MPTFLKAKLILVTWVAIFSRMDTSQRKVVVALLLFTIFVENERYCA